MKAVVTLEFNLPEDDVDFKEKMEAISHSSLPGALAHEILQEIFRPARKHGYKEPKFNAALEDGHTHLLMELLEEKFHEILMEYKIDV